MSLLAEFWLQKCKDLASKTQSKLSNSILTGTYLLNVYIFDVKLLQKFCDRLKFDSMLLGLDYNNIKLYMYVESRNNFKEYVHIHTYLDHTFLCQNSYSDQIVLHCKLSCKSYACGTHNSLCHKIPIYSLHFENRNRILNIYVDNSLYGHH